MKSAFRCVQIVLLLCGASGVETEMSVIEGDSVTLHTGVKINQQGRIRWYYNDFRIAQISGGQSKICTDAECPERFRGRLELDHQTGSLTVININTTDSGLYRLQINISSNEKSFRVTVQGGPADDVKSVKEGESVTLYPGEINNSNDSMTWLFNDVCIAAISGDQRKTCTDERFRGRLELDQTGSLTVTDTRTTDSGDYTLHINSSSFSVRRTRSFSVSGTGSGWSSAAVAGVSAAGVTLLVAAAAAAVIYKHKKSITAKLKNETDPVKYSSVSQNEATANGASQKKTATETPA